MKWDDRGQPKTQSSGCLRTSIVMGACLVMAVAACVNGDWIIGGLVLLAGFASLQAVA